MEPWRFGRVAKVASSYDEARKRGEKHSAAVRETVDSLRLANPEMPISETEVRRILSRHRPRGSETILLFERVPSSEEDIEKRRLMRKHIRAWEGSNGAALPPLPADSESHRREKFLISFGKRPDYPRHNRKAPNE